LYYATEDEKTEAENAKGKSPAALIGIIIGAVVIAGGVVMMFLKKKK
jgi:flagellar basal body-associated protein FliL